MTLECDYQNIDCDLRDEFGGCTIDTHPMEYCPGDEDEDDDE